MSALAVEEKMLYCPKCNRRYDDGSQRFCNNDGGRLLPDLPVKRQSGGSKDKSVFTNLLGRTAPRNERDEKLATKPRFERVQRPENKFEAPQKSQTFKTQENFQPKPTKPQSVTNFQDTRKKEPSRTEKPLSRLITTNEVKIDRARLGDRRVNPTGRLALDWNNPEILLGQTIKGRYYITGKLAQDSASIAYLADDKIIHGKKAIVRVLMEENSKESLEDKIFAEERISLSHINHPNIARVIDSGELPEGKPFIVTDYFDGTSVKELIDGEKELNPMRVARIVRQTSYALSEVHQNGILHRSLKPEQILLTVSEAGIEQVKVKDFCVSIGRDANTNFQYKSPEQVGGQLPTFASDTYSLGVIAYQMLTGKLPFEASSARELLKAQKKGLEIKPSEIKPELPKSVDDVIEKALTFNATDRYPKARDFGDAIYNALMTSPTALEETEKKEEISSGIKQDQSEISTELTLPTNLLNDVKKETADISLEPAQENPDIHIASTAIEPLEESDFVTIDIENEEEVSEKPATATDTLWEKRSPEPARERNGIFTILSILGLLALVIGAVWIWRYFGSMSDQPIAPIASDQSEKLKEKDPTIKNAETSKANAVKPSDGIEVPPPEREIPEPPNSKFFENSKQNLDKDLAKNFRGFSLFYPEKWSLNKSSSNFLDISKKDEDGLPKEQMLITYYDSNGTFELDKKKFSALVEKSNDDLKKIVPNYDVVSQGNIEVNNGWKSYEVKFRGKTNFKNQENFEIWGRRIWMPAARPGVKNGFVITMLATSLSDKIESLDDVGKKGDLGDILYTFEPDRSY